MLRSIHHGGLPPAEEEVPQRHAQHQRHAEPHVVSHEHQHEDVGGGRLDDVEQRLDDMRGRQHGVPGEVRIRFFNFYMSFVI